MTILIYFLTIVFGIVCFVIMKKKRYKVRSLICLIMFFIKRTELSAYGDCGYRYLLRVQA